MIFNLYPIFVLLIKIIHRRGPRETANTELSRNFCAKLKDFLPTSYIRDLQLILTRLINLAHWSGTVHIDDLTTVGMTH